MHRLSVVTECLSCDTPELLPEQVRHLRVLRPDEDERIELFDGCGHARVYAFSRPLCLRACAPLVTLPRPRPTVTLFACITKGSRWDWTLEKATELGVSRIVPVISNRTIVRIPASERAAKCERWQRIVLDAARQSDAHWLPEISVPVVFADTLPMVRTCTCFIGALVPDASPMPLAEAVLAVRDHATDFGVYIGPEGDFTSDELAALIAIARPTSFGSTILRAETAAIFALSVVMSLVRRT